MYNPEFRINENTFLSFIKFNIGFIYLIKCLSFTLYAITKVPFLKKKTRNA